MNFSLKIALFQYLDNEDNLIMDSIGNSGGCTGYHGIWARSESIDDTISQRLRSSTRSCCGTLVSPITISTFNSPHFTVWKKIHSHLKNISRRELFYL